MSEAVAQFLNLLVSTAIGLAALSSLISLFRSGDKFRDTDINDFKTLVLSCLLLCLGGLLPFLLDTVYDGENIWAISSLAYGITGFSLLTFFQILIRRKQIIIASNFVSIAFRITSLLVVILTFANWLIFQLDIIYLVALFWGLGLSILRLYVFLIIVTSKPEGGT